MVSMNLEKLALRSHSHTSHNSHAGAHLRVPGSLLDGEAIGNRAFALAKTEEQLFGPDAIQVTVPAWTSFPEGDDEAPRTSKRAALSGKEEAAMFLRYNYARYRLGRLLAKHAGAADRAQRREIDLWHRRMMDCKETLARANMALVVAMAKRTRIPNVEFSELVSEGNMAMLRSIEKFDVSRGFKFSTYACRSILKSFNRLATKTGRYRRLFPTEFDPELEKSDGDVHRHEVEQRDSVEEVREMLRSRRTGLSELERKVLVQRFAIGSSARQAMTLAEVGRTVGLTNERVRQIQNSALAKLRAVMSDGEGREEPALALADGT
jgi:RNA polymerase sigma factor (sigma-70 family)